MISKTLLSILNCQAVPLRTPYHGSIKGQDITYNAALFEGPLAGAMAAVDPAELGLTPVILKDDPVPEPDRKAQLIHALSAIKTRPLRTLAEEALMKKSYLDKLFLGLQNQLIRQAPDVQFDLEVIKVEEMPLEALGVSCVIVYARHADEVRPAISYYVAMVEPETPPFGPLVLGLETGQYRIERSLLNDYQSPTLKFVLATVEARLTPLHPGAKWLYAGMTLLPRSIDLDNLTWLQSFTNILAEACYTSLWLFRHSHQDLSLECGGFGPFNFEGHWDSFESKSLTDLYGRPERAEVHIGLAAFQPDCMTSVAWVYGYFDRHRKKNRLQFVITRLETTLSNTPGTLLLLLALIYEMLRDQTPNTSRQELLKDFDLGDRRPEITLAVDVPVGHPESWPWGPFIAAAQDFKGSGMQRTVERLLEFRYEDTRDYGRVERHFSGYYDGGDIRNIDHRLMTADAAWFQTFDPIGVPEELRMIHREAILQGVANQLVITGVTNRLFFDAEFMDCITNLAISRRLRLTIDN
jgi:hypothetical protein